MDRNLEYALNRIAALEARLAAAEARIAALEMRQPAILPPVFITQPSLYVQPTLPPPVICGHGQATVCGSEFGTPS